MCACVAQLAALAHPVYADGKGTDACRGNIGVRSPCHPDCLCDGDRGRALVGSRLGAEAISHTPTLPDKTQGPAPGEKRRTDCGAICGKVPVENRQTDRRLPMRLSVVRETMRIAGDMPVTQAPHSDGGEREKGRRGEREKGRRGGVKARRWERRREGERARREDGKVRRREGEKVRS